MLLSCLVLRNGKCWETPHAPVCVAQGRDEEDGTVSGATERAEEKGPLSSLQYNFIKG